MKKNVLFLSLIPTLLFTGCNQQSVDKSKIALDYGYIRENRITSWSQFEDLTYDELDALITSTTIKSNFVLITYNSITCGCFINFTRVIMEYANENHVDFYFFDVARFDGHSEKYGIYSATQPMPGICFFRRGKLIRQTIYGKTKENARKMFSDQDAFNKFMADNIYLPKMYYLDKSVLDEKIANNEEFNLYVARKKCGDCQAINEKVLNPWSTKNKDKTVNDLIYIFDIDPYRGTEDYQLIKDTYGLSVEGNPTFGFDTGYIPTFQRRTGSTITDMITVLNDQATSENVVVSYFNQARVSASPILKDTGTTFIFDGMHIESSEVEPWGFVKQDVQLTWHTPIVELYLSTYVK